MRTKQIPWNKGKLVGQTAPLRLIEIWSIRIPLQIEHKTGVSRSSIWRLTRSCAAATWSACVSATSPRF